MSDQNSNLSPDVEQKIHLLRVELQKTAELLRDDLHDIDAILKMLECEIDDETLPYEQRLKFCPHCCLVAEQKRKTLRLESIEQRLETCQ